MTSEDEYSATDSDSESSDEMLEVSGCDPVDDISMQSPFMHSPQDNLTCPCIERRLFPDGF